MTIRTRLLLVVVAAVAVAVTAMTAGVAFLFVRSVHHSVDAVLRQRADSERAVLRVTAGHVRSVESETDVLADSRVWVYDGRRPIEVPRAGRVSSAAVQRLVGGPRRYLDLPGLDERLFAAPIIGAHGERAGTIVVGISTAPYEQTRRTAFAGAIALGAALLLIAATSAWWLLRSALRPVAQMTVLAEEWSEHDLERRFAVGEPNDEISHLAHTLDRLLDRIGASLRHERRFTAELAHEIRTPLARAIAESELALRRERTADEYRDALALVHRNAQQISRIVDSLVAAAQHEASPSPTTADAYDVVADVLATVAPLASERSVDVVAERPERPLRVGVDGDLAARALQPVLENACRYARSHVSIAIAADDGRVAFHVRDDGPGLGEGEPSVVFDPGVRGAAAAATPGAGLGLALARRIARSITGDVTARAGAGGDFTVSLPRA